MNKDELAIQRRRKIAQMLMQQGMEPLETNQVAGGYVVPVSPLSAISKVAQQLSGAYIDKQADVKEDAFKEKQTADLTKAFEGGDIDYKGLAQSGIIDNSDLVKLLNDRKIQEQKLALDQAKANLPTTSQRDALYAAGGDEVKARQLIEEKMKNPFQALNYQLQSGNVAQDNARSDQSLMLQQQNAMRQQQAFERQQESTDRQNQIKQNEIDVQNWRLENPNYEKNQQAILDAETNYQKLIDTLDNYSAELGKYDQIDRHNPLANSELQTNYQAATWPLRDESMVNTGVLNPGDKAALEAALQNPTSALPAGWRSNEELKSQIEALKNVAKTNVNAIKNNKAPKTQPPIKRPIMDEMPTIPEGQGKVNISPETWKNMSTQEKKALNDDINNSVKPGDKQKRLDALRQKHGIK